MERRLERRCNWVIFFTLVALVFILPLIFDRRLEDVFDLPKVTVLRLAVVLMASVWLIKIIFSGKLFFRRNNLNWPVVGFIVVSFLALLKSVHLHTSLVGGYKFYFWGFWALGCFVFLYFVAANILEVKKIKMVVSVVILSTGFVLLYGLMQKLGLDPYSWSRDPYNRIFSSLGNPNFLGAFMAMVLPLGLSEILLFRKNIFRGFLCLWFAAGFAVLLFSLTRSSWLGFLAAMFVWLVFLGKKFYREARIWMMVLIIGVASITVFSSFPFRKNRSPVRERMAVLVDPKETGAAARLSCWRSCVKMLKGRPFLGTGPDTFGFVFPRYEEAKFVQVGGRNMIPTNAHNETLQIATTLGLVGLGVYGWLLVNFFWGAWKKYWGLSAEERILLVGLVSSCVGLLVHAQFNFSIVTTCSYFWIFLGATAGLGENQTTTLVNQHRNWWVVRLGAGIVLLIGLSFLGNKAVNAYRADRYYKTGQGFENSGRMSEAIEFYQKALRLNPWIDNGVIRLRLARIYRKRTISAADSAEARFWLDKVEEVFQKNVDLFPRHAQDHNNLAMAYLWKAKFLGDVTINEACSELSCALKLSPYYIDILHNLALVNLYFGDIEECHRIWEKILKLDPTFTKAKNLLELSAEEPRLLKSR